MTELRGQTQGNGATPEGSTTKRWMGRVTARVVAAIVIGMVSPHLPTIGSTAPPDETPRHGVAVVCIMDDGS